MGSEIQFRRWVENTARSGAKTIADKIPACK